MMESKGNNERNLLQIFTHNFLSYWDFFNPAKFRGHFMQETVIGQMIFVTDLFLIATYY